MEGNIIDAFPVGTANTYQENIWEFNEPKLLGHFSIDSEQAYSEDAKQLKFLSLPPIKTKLNYDLKKDYDKYVSFDYTKFNINCFLKWISTNQSIIHSEEATASKQQKKDIDFVLSRGDMVRVAQSLYLKKSWMICATKFRGTIYMLTFLTEEAIKKEKNLNPQTRLIFSYGYKFEKYITSETSGGEPSANSPVNEGEHFFVVEKNMLNEHSLLYTAEIDAVDPNQLHLPEFSPKRYVEIKTLVGDENENLKYKIRRSVTLRWWLQSFLAGIPRVICGLRNFDGVVHTIKTFQTADIAMIAEWSRTACMSFLSKFLSFVKKCVTEDDPHVVYEFCITEHQVRCRKSSSQQYEILPEWFISSFND